MSDQEYEVVEKLEQAGYDAVLRIAKAGYMLKVKRTVSNGKIQPTEGMIRTVESETMVDKSLQPKAFVIPQKYHYLLKTVDTEIIEAGKPGAGTAIPFAIFVKEFSQIG